MDRLAPASLALLRCDRCDYPAQASALLVVPLLHRSGLVLGHRFGLACSTHAGRAGRRAIVLRLVDIDLGDLPGLSDLGALPAELVDVADDQARAELAAELADVAGLEEVAA